jgi:dolichol kinase
MKTGKSWEMFEAAVFSALAVLTVFLTSLLLNIGFQGQMFG